MVPENGNIPKTTCSPLSDEDIVYASMKIEEQHEVLTRTNGVTTGELSRGPAR